MKSKDTALALALILFPAAAGAQETIVSQQDIKQLSVTVYNNGLGLVKDTRAVQFRTGDNTISFAGVSALIKPETAIISADGTSIIEQNFNFDLMSRQALLQKYTGKDIKVIKTNPVTGKDTEETATVLSSDNGIILKIGNRIETDYGGRLIFPEVPKNLRDKPTLTVDFFSAGAGKKDINLNYLTDGIYWQADYAAELNDAENELALNGWVTVTNQSGTDYKNADMQFVAGSVHRQNAETARFGMRKNVLYSDSMQAAGAAPEMTEEALMDYHMYSLGRKTSVLSNQKKQLALLTAPKIKAKKTYIFRDIIPAGYFYINNIDKDRMNSAAVFLSFNNKKSDGLGKPLPEGTIRVYKADRASRLFFVGEDTIKHTPENEEVKLNLGQAFDITERGRQTQYRELPAETAYPANNLRPTVYKVTESDYELTFKNAKDTPQTVTYSQALNRNWTIIKSNTDYKKDDALRAEWEIKIPAKGYSVLKLTIRERYSIRNN